MHVLRRWMLRPRWRAIAVNAGLAALILAGLTAAYWTVLGSKTGNVQPDQRQRAVAVSRGTVTATVTAAGTVRSATTANATFSTSGTVTEVAVAVGELVSKGQVLAKVDPADANEDLATARADLSAAQQALARATAGDSDDATVASLRAQVTKAQTGVASAERAVAGTVLTAPIAGTVTAINGSVGSSAGSSGSGSGSGGSAGSGGSSGSGSTGGGSTGGGSTGGGSAGGSTQSGFIQLADLTSLQVEAAFAEADATRLKPGQRASVQWSALSGARATGAVASVAPTATSSNNVNTYAVLTALDSAPTGARIGQSATVVVTVEEVTDVLRLPTTAVTTAGSRSTVQVRSGDRVEARDVTVGVRGDEYVELTSGVTEGDQAVITVTVTASGSAGAGGTGRGGGAPGGLTGGGLTGGGPPAGGAGGGGR